MDLTWFWTWLRQPSTLRVLNVLLAFAEYQLMPELYELIIGLAIAAWMVIDGFYNQQPRN